MIEVPTITNPDYKWSVKPIKGWEVNLEERPCLWNRIWYRLIFNWRFERI